MTVRAVVFGFALAASEAVRELFNRRPPQAVIHVIRDIQCPPYCYVKIDERVFAVKL